MLEFNNNRGTIDSIPITITCLIPTIASIYVFFPKCTKIISTQSIMIERVLLNVNSTENEINQIMTNEWCVCDVHNLDGTQWNPRPRQSLVENVLSLFYFITHILSMDVGFLRSFLHFGHKVSARHVVAIDFVDIHIRILSFQQIAIDVWETFQQMYDMIAIATERIDEWKLIDMNEWCKLIAIVTATHFLNLRCAVLSFSRINVRNRRTSFPKIFGLGGSTCGEVCSVLLELYSSCSTAATLAHATSNRITCRILPFRCRSERFRTVVHHPRRSPAYDKLDSVREQPFPGWSSTHRPAIEQRPIYCNGTRRQILSPFYPVNSFGTREQLVLPVTLMFHCFQHVPLFQ